MRTKTTSQTPCRLPRLVCIAAVAVAFLSGSGVTPASAQSDDLGRFDDQESYYLASGVAILLHRVPDEIVVRFNSTNPPLAALEDWKSSSGNDLNGVKEVYGGAVVCRATITNDAAAILEALRKDAQVRYAFPVYRGTTGSRVFLIDEVAVGPQLDDRSALSSYGLVFKKRSSFTLYRILSPNSVNPFKLCDVLRAQPGVVWAEPNKSQEFIPYPPVITPVVTTLQTNLVGFPAGSGFTNYSLLTPLVPAFTSLSRSNDSLVVEWNGPFTLQFADAPDGPWTDVVGATSPHAALISGAAGFFRLRWLTILETGDDSP